MICCQYKTDAPVGLAGLPEIPAPECGKPATVRIIVVPTIPDCNPALCDDCARLFRAAASDFGTKIISERAILTAEPMNSLSE